MLKKSLRLRTQKDFERVFRKGTPLFFGAIGCKIAKNDLGFLRLGFSLSKKHLDKAVSRNRVRRVASAAFLGISQENAQKSLDVVFFTTKKLERKDISTVASQAQSVVECISSKF